MSAILVIPSRKYFDGYLEACEEYKNIGEKSFFHDIYSFASLKHDEEITFNTWKNGVLNQYYYDTINGQIKRLKLPVTVFWLIDETGYLGLGMIRHRMTKAIAEYGGHIGYALRPTKFHKGYGKLLLKLLLKEAYKLKINPALVTCDEENIPSKKVIEANGGKLYDKLPTRSDGKDIILCRYWVPTKIK